MKKIYFLTIVFLLFSLALKGQTVLSEDFEGGTDVGWLPAGWTTIDANNDGRNWRFHTYSGNGAQIHSGNGCMISDSWYSGMGACTPDNWLITPSVTLPANAVLYYWVIAQESYYTGENYGVYISTNGGNTPNDFISLFEESFVPSTYEQRNISLAAYAGQTVRVAFRHYNCYDQWWMNIDDVVITNDPSSGGGTTPVDPEPSDNCALQIHLERTLGYSSSAYSVYYTVNDNWSSRTLLELDPSTASFDTTLLLPPSTTFELWGSTGGSDFNCQITDGSGGVYTGSYYPNYKTLDACSPVCDLYVTYGCSDTLLSISEPRWIQVFAGDNNYNPWGNLYQSSWTAIGRTYGTMIPVSAGFPLRFVWTEPDEVNHNSYFVLRDNATNQELFRKNAGEVLPNGEFLVYTPNCGSCGASDRCPLTIHLERNANDPDHPGEYILEYFVGGDYSALHEIHLGPSESSKDTTLMLCPEIPFELYTKWESGVGTYGGSDFSASFENAYGNVVYDGYAPSYTTEDPCARSCEYALRVGAATNLSSVSSTWFEIFEGNSTTPSRTIGLSNYTSGTYYWAIPVMAGKTYRFVWHDPDPENHATFFNLRDQDDQVIFEKTSYSVLPDGEFLVVTPTCQAVLITTNPVTNITEYSAKGGGTVHTNAIDNYNSSYGIDYGICYGTTPNPTVNGTHTTSHSYSSGNFSFTHTMPNLQDNTTYYVRAYVTYMGETTYGDVVQFTTPQAYFCQTPSSVTGYGLTGSSTLVTWTVQNVTMPIESYALQYKRASDADWSAEISVADTQYVLNGLQSNTEYNVRVRSVCESTTSSWETGSFTTPVALMNHLYVTTDGSGNGSSWANAMSGLSDALRLAASIHQMYDTTVTIWVAAGTYYGDVDSLQAFKMYEGVNVYGGFAGNEPDNYDLSLRDFEANATILDGQNSRRVLYQDGSPTQTVVWDGFTIQNGAANYTSGNTWSGYGGGAILAQAFEMRNCRFLHNYSYSDGGAVLLRPNVSNPAFKFQNCVFSYNRSDDEGGAVASNIYMMNVNPDTLDLNLIFEHCDFTYNSADEHSALTDFYGILKFYNCKFKYNSAVSPSSGATYSGTVEGGRLFVNCEISHNKANEYAGLSNSTASLLNCIIVNNEDVNSYHAFSSGLYNFRGVMTNCVVWGNKVDGVPVNIYSTIYGYDEMLIQNSAIEGGFDFDGNPNNTFITLESENYGDAAGRNYPFFACPENGDYRPRGQSALVNAGVDYPDMPTQDLAGEARVYGGTIDIGCYEYQGEDLCIAPITMAAQDVYGTSATITWQNANPNEPLYYELSYKQENETTWTVYPGQLHTTWAMLSGLQPQTNYVVRLRTFCDAGHTSEYSPELNFTTSCANGYIHTTLVNGTTDYYWTFGGLPFDDGYSYSQQIFRADEMGSAGTIDTIYLQHDQTSQAAVRNVDIYMAHTLRTNFETGDDWIPFEQLTLVYSGNITVDCAADGTWIPVPLQVPFDYNGENNLALVFDDNTYDWINYYEGFRSHKTTEKTSMSVSRRMLDFDFTNLPTSYSLETECMNIIFAGSCATGGCDRANLSVMDVTPTSATLAFIQGANATNSDLQYRKVGDETYIVLPTSSSPYTLQGLTQNTEYEVRMRSKCGFEYGTWRTVRFRTGLKNLSRLYVTTTGNGDGSSWANATHDFLWALETAEMMKQTFGTAPDIWVAEGTYYGDTLHRDAFFMKEGVNVYGGFVGNEPDNYDLSQRDFAHHASILDGNNRRRVLNQREKFAEHTTWDGFTIQHGYLEQYIGNAAGAYLRGSVSLYNCVITNNNGNNGDVGGLQCRGDEHSIYVHGAYQTIYDSIFIRNCVISHNTNGGAIFDQHVLAENCVIEYNTSEYDGGGVTLRNGAKLRNSVVRHNTALREYYSYNELYHDGYGGGVFAGGRTVVENCEITHNVAAYGGGVCDATGGNDSYMDYKSGIFNCLIANNTAYKGGGVYCNTDSRVVGSTIVNNMIESENDEDLGAGVIGDHYTLLLNCIIWGNKRNGTPEGYVHKQRDYITFEANHVASDVAIEGEHNILLLSDSYANGIFSPRFVHPSETIGANDSTENVDWHLQEGSACINRGDTLVFGTTDLDGLARVQQDTVDLGCYESPYNGVTLPVLPDSIVYVKEGGAGTGLGDSWENAAASLTDAINIAALNRAQVWVAAGTYYGADASAENAFEMKQGVNVYGGFEGNEPPTFPLEERDFEHNVSILDGQQQQRVLYQPQDFIAEDSVVWDGFTIQNGRTTGNGAGVYMRAYSRLKNCIVQNNVIEGYGEKKGSGIYVYYEKSHSQGYYHASGYTKISHCKIINNGAEMTTATIYGGGLYALVAEIDHTEFAHNVASYGGGACAHENVYFSNCLIHNNKASLYGGGVYVEENDVQMMSCNIVRNTVARSNGGGGLYNKYDTWGTWGEWDTLLMRNCIVWGNKFEGTDNNWQSPTYQEEVSVPDNIVQVRDINTSMKYCAVEGGHVGTGNVMLAPENDKFNGEQQYVRFMDVAHEDFRLHPLSACVNKGGNEFVDADIDFYGNTRIYDTLVDIGCSEAGEVECLPVTSVTVTVDCDSVQLVWNRVSMENQWELSYGEEGAEPTVILLNDTIYTIYDLPRGKNYTAFVRSVCSAEKQSDPSSSANFRTSLCLPDVIVCTPVPSMTADVQCDSVVLTWNRGENEEQWLVSYGKTNATPTELLVSDTVYTLKNLTYDHSYTAYVFAVCNDTLVSDTSVWVNFVARDCNPPECPAVTGLAADVTCDSVKLRWNRYDATHWVVSWGLAGEEHVLDTIEDNVYILRNLPLDHVCTVSVSALCNGGTMLGESSPLVSFRTQCLHPRLLPDLHVIDVQYSNPVVAQTMRVQWTVKNDGDGDTQFGATWNDYIYFSPVAEVRNNSDDSYLLATVPNMQSLQAGESYTNYTDVEIPEDFDPGSYYLFVLANQVDAYDIDYTPTGGVAPNPYTPSVTGDPYPYLAGHTHNAVGSGENPGTMEVEEVRVAYNSSLYDDFFYVVLDVLPTTFPDLVVTSITHPTDVFSGNQIPVTWTVQNQGSYKAEGRWEDKIYLSQDSLWSSGSLLVGTYIHSVDERLLPDSSYQQTLQITVPINYMGEYQIFVHTDQALEVYESLGEGNNLTMSPQNLNVIMSPYPDLMVTDIDMPAVVANNETYDIRYTVTNMGYGPTYATAWHDAFYMSQETVFDSVRNENWQYWNHGSNYHSGVLYPGESYEEIMSVQIPSDIYGEWNIFVQANSDNAVFEYDADTNNVTMFTIQVSPPDLTVTNVSVTPDTAWSGTEIEVSYTLKNLSGGTAYWNPRSSMDRMRDVIYYGTSPDSYENGTASAIDVFEYTTFRLEVGEEQTYTRTVTVPDGSNGPGYIFVECNGGEILFENGQVNNNVGASDEMFALLSPWPDIKVTRLTAPAQTVLGSYFTVEYTVRNDGIIDLNNAAVTQAFIPSNSPTVYPIFETASVVHDVLTLAVGEEVTKTAEIRMKPTKSPGSYYLHMLVDADREVYEYTGENNNYVVSNQFEALRYPLDLAIVELDVPDTVEWGQQVTIRMNVKNLSDVCTTDSLWCQLYLSDNSSIAFLEPILDRPLTGLAPGADVWIEKEYVIPLGSPARAHLIARLYLRDNPDIDDSNNKIDTILTVNSVPVPDLCIVDAWVLDEVYCGQPARLAYKVKNISEVPVENQNWLDKLKFEWRIGTYHVYSRELMSYAKTDMTLGHDEFYLDTVEFTIPQHYAGEITLKLTANDDQNRSASMYEFYRNNNMVSIPITVYEQAPGDLIVTHVSSNDTVIAGGILHVQWNVENVGINPMQGRNLRTLVYVSVDTVFDAGDRFLGSLTTDLDLAAGASVQQSLDARVSGLSMGEYYLIVKTDVYNAFHEDDDNNNSGCSAEPFMVGVRLLPFNTDVPDTLVNNEPSDFMLTVGDHTRQTVRVHLHSEDSLLGAFNQIYATYNQMGDNLNYTYSTIGQYTANPELYIPYTMQGYYGINVYGSTPEGDEQNTILRADTLPFVLMSVNANHGGNTGEVTLELTGSRFRPDMVVCLRNGNDTICADTVIFENYYQAFARFNLAGKATGIYDVTALNFCEGEAVLPNAFTIEEESPYALSYNLQFPTAPRVERSVVMMLEFGNIGNVDLHNQMLEITSNGGCPIALSPDEVNLGQRVLRIPLNINGEPEGLLRPGSYGYINIYTYTSGALIFSIVPKSVE